MRRRPSSHRRPDRRVLPLRQRGLDIVMNACIREPLSTNILRLFTEIRLEDLRRYEIQKNNPSTKSPNRPLLITEKVVNQLIKSLLLANQPEEAYTVWLHVMRGEPLPNHPIYTYSRILAKNFSPIIDKSLHPYLSLGYRLHSLSADGLINHLLNSEPHRRINESLTSQRIYSGGQFVHTSLLHAFQMVLQTNFIEGQADSTPLLRLFNTVLRAVMAPSDSVSFYKGGNRARNAWLVVQIYKFILHSNESIARTEQRMLTTETKQSPGQDGDIADNHQSSSSSMMVSPKDHPWSYRDHRSYLQLNWRDHYRPMIHICVAALRQLQPDGTLEDVENSQGTPFDPLALLDTIFYDIRLSFPNYAHLRHNTIKKGVVGAEEEVLTQAELGEIIALETQEATQQLLLDTTIIAEATKNAAELASAASITCKNICSSKECKAQSKRCCQR